MIFFTSFRFRFLIPFILFLFYFSLPGYAVQNTSLSKVLVKFQGNEFNLLIAKPNLVGVTNHKEKTKKAIMLGFSKEVKNIRRLIKSRNLHVNIKIPNPQSSDILKFKEIDVQVYNALSKLIEVETDIHSRILEELKRLESPLVSKNNPESEAYDPTSAEEIEFDPDKMLETTRERVKFSEVTLSPDTVFNNILLDVGELYTGKDIIAVNQVKIPYGDDDNVIFKPVHSTFGVAFFPTTFGAIKQMRMYIFLFVVNTESDGSNIAFKEIQNFRWDRNELYISAATGKVLSQIISEILGEPVR